MIQKFFRNPREIKRNDNATFSHVSHVSVLCFAGAGKGGPPKLEKQQSKKVKTIRLTFETTTAEKNSSSKEEKLFRASLPKQPKKLISEEKQNFSPQISTNFTFECSSCPKSWPLHSLQIDKISQHLSTSGTAPLVKSTRVAFSQLFTHFSYKVRLQVNPKASKVSTRTGLQCNHCSSSFDLSSTNEDLALSLHEHLEKRHSCTLVTNFCYFCDRKVTDLQRHLNEYFHIHHSRILALATCKHPDSVEADLIEVECKKCFKLYVPDLRLPDWMSRASCNSCLSWCLERESSSSNISASNASSSRVILCQFCRQGKFGWTKSCQRMSLSICVNCSKMAGAFRQMTDVSQCQNYVTGMLNELVSSKVSYCFFFKMTIFLRGTKCVFSFDCNQVEKPHKSISHTLPMGEISLKTCALMHSGFFSGFLILGENISRQNCQTQK